MFPKVALQRERLERPLVAVSLSYLALPYLIFCIGWMQWYWALAAIGLLMVAVIESVHLLTSETLATTSLPEDSSFASRHLIALLLISLAWLSLSGVGGIGYQRGDWVKHESILRDLMDYDWPVVYNYFAVPVPLVYYLAYYLPAALAGKIGGWAVAQIALFGWTFLGVNLALLWFWLLARTASHPSHPPSAHLSKPADRLQPTGTRVYSLFLIFVFFSGCDLIGRLITSWAGGSMEGWEGIDQWHDVLKYNANTDLLYWVPNQALAGWIAGGVTLFAILRVQRRRITWLPVALSTLWTPFVTIGLVPYLIAEFLSDGGPLLVRLRRYLTWSSLCALLLMLIMALFYLSKLYEVSPYTRGEFPHGFYFTTGTASPLGPVGSLVTFWLVEFGLFALLLLPAMKLEGRLWRWIFAATLVYLTLLPLYRAGLYNDLVMRASIPALFCLAVFVGRAIHRPAVGLPTRIALAIVLLAGAGTTVLESFYQVRGVYRSAMGLPNAGLIETRGILAVYGAMSNHLLQYVGAYQSPFFQYLAKNLDATNPSDERRYIAFADHKILFDGYDLEKDAALRPGEPVKLISRLYVFFEAIDKNYNLSIRLVAEEASKAEGNGKVVWSEQGWPQNRPTSVWAPSLLWLDTRTLIIPPEAPAGIYRLDLGFVDPNTHELLPAVAVPSGKYLGEQVPIGYVTVGDVEEQPGYSFPEPAHLGNQMALLGMTPAPEQVASQLLAPGESLHIRLFWQALTTMDRDYTGFVHLVDASGALVAQDDHQPRNGFLPTSIWREGLVIADDYTIRMPQAANPGRYSLIAGMYDLESGIRLPVAQGGESTGNTILLAQFEAP